MSEYKYLSDGRKVVVIGQLNNVESIVQEIFITESGDQVPSGEKFTTKNLHDEPVASWKAKEEKKIESRIGDAENRLSSINSEIDSISVRRNGLKEMFKQSSLLLKHLEEQDLDVLASVMSGACEWLVVDNYGTPELVRFDDKIIDTERSWSSIKFDGLKLISFMGKSDGSLSYRVNRYSDGSGGGSTVFPFEKREDAAAKIKEMVLDKMNAEKNPYLPDLQQYEKLLSYGISFNKKITAKIKSNALNGKKDWLKTLEERHTKSVTETNEEISEINEVFKTL